MKLKTGDVIFTRMPLVWYKPIRFVSWAIRKVLKTWFNHIAIYIELYGKPYVAESTIGGVRIIPFDKWAKDSEIEVKTPTFIEPPFEIGHNIMAYQGFTGYDYTSLIWYQIILQATGKWKGQKGAKAQKKLYCSEYAALIYSNHFPGWWKVTPKDLYLSDKFKKVWRGPAIHLVNHKTK